MNDNSVSRIYGNAIRSHAPTFAAILARAQKPPVTEEVPLVCDPDGLCKKQELKPLPDYQDCSAGPGAGLKSLVAPPVSTPVNKASGTPQIEPDDCNAAPVQPATFIRKRKR